MALQCDTGNLVFREQITHGSTSLDGKQGEVVVEEHLLQLRVGFHHHLYHLGLAVGVGGKV